MKKQKFYAVIDTNILVSAMWSKNPVSPTFRIIDFVFSGKIVPIIHKKILEEYNRVLRYKKFKFSEFEIEKIVNTFKDNGIKKRQIHSAEIFPDETDRIFYEVALNARNDFDAELVTGNAKHFPAKPFVVSAREMLKIVESS